MFANAPEAVVRERTLQYLVVSWHRTDPQAKARHRLGEGSRRAECPFWTMEVEGKREAEVGDSGRLFVTLCPCAPFRELSAGYESC